MGVNMEIMAPGRRVFELRRLFKLTQAQVLKDRTNLSNIENCKYNLTLDVAEKIAPILEKARIENNVRMQEITAEFLMRDEKKQADEIMEKIIRELISFKKNADMKKKEFESLCENAQLFIRKYFILLDEQQKDENQKKETKIDEKQIIEIEKQVMEIYDLIINITYDIHEYRNSLIYATAALEASNRFSNYDYRIKYYSKMIKASSKMGNYDTALGFCEFAFRLNQQYSIEKSEYLKEIYRNYVLVLKKKAVEDMDYNLFNKCFEVYEEAIKNKILDDYSKSYIKSILGNIYAERKDYKMAIITDFEALNLAEKVRDVDLVGLISGNIAERAMELNDRELAIEYIQKTNKTKKEQSNTFSACNSKVNMCLNIKFDNLQFVKESYKNIINSNIKAGEKSYRIEIIDNVFEYFLKKNVEHMENFLEFIKDKIINKEIDHDLQKLELMFFKASYKLGTKKIKSITAEIEKFIEK